MVKECGTHSDQVEKSLSLKVVCFNGIKQLMTFVAHVTIKVNVTCTVGTLYSQP